MILMSTKIDATASNSSMERCKQKAEYERQTDGILIQSKRAKLYVCGYVHFMGEVFLCHAHAHQDLNENIQLAGWFQRLMG